MGGIQIQFRGSGYMERIQIQFRGSQIHVQGVLDTWEVFRYSVGGPEYMAGIQIQFRGYQIHGRYLDFVYGVQDIWEVSRYSLGVTRYMGGIQILFTGSRIYGCWRITATHQTNWSNRPVRILVGDVYFPRTILSWQAANTIYQVVIGGNLLLISIEIRFLTSEKKLQLNI